MTGFESVVEQAAIEWLRALGYDYVPGPALAPDGEAPERPDYETPLLEGRFRAALARINAHLPAEALDDVARQVLRGQSPSLDEDHVASHRRLIHGIAVQVRRGDEVRGDLALIIDFDHPEENDWLVVNHLHESVLQRAVRDAVMRARLEKLASCPTPRHSFATHFLESGYDIRMIQKRLAHHSVMTMMICADVLGTR